MLVPIVYTIMHSPPEISFSKINLKNLANYFSYLINYNEDDSRVHDQIILNLIEKMLYELNLNHDDKFNKLAFVLLEFYNPEVINRKNGDTIRNIYQKLKCIMVSKSLKKNQLLVWLHFFLKENLKYKLCNKTDQLKAFNFFIKNCFNSLADKKDSKTCTKARAAIKRKVTFDDEISEIHEGENISKRLKL